MQKTLKRKYVPLATPWPRIFSGKKEEAPPTYFERLHSEYKDSGREPMWIVYDQNTDAFPGQYVAQMFVREPETASTDLQIIGATLSEVRAKLPRKLFWTDRQSADDPTIVEIWV